MFFLARQRFTGNTFFHFHRIISSFILLTAACRKTAIKRNAIVIQGQQWLREQAAVLPCTSISHFV